MTPLFSILFWLTSAFLFLTPAGADSWVNPKQVIQDPAIARLQQGRKELTPREKEEIAKYGFTGLEIMTYLEGNKYPGHDWDCYYRWMMIEAGGHIRVNEMLLRKMLTYPDHRALVARQGIRPGDLRILSLSVFIYPPAQKDNVSGSLTYLTDQGSYKAKEIYTWISQLRRIKRSAAPGVGDPIFGGEVTEEDNTERQPWHEEHRILGEDNFRGHDCLVVESVNRLHQDYYLSKRVTWVEKHQFIDLHEEQFDRQGKLWKVFDLEWQQFSPWNYWARTLWNVLDLSSKHRTVWQIFDYLFDQGLKKENFSRQALASTLSWRKARVPPQPQGASDLPPEPRVREEFWSRLGLKPELAR